MGPHGVVASSPVVGSSGSVEPDTGPAPTGPSRRVRIAVYAFLAVFVGCGLFSIEQWPLTGFRLYTAIRTEERPSTRVIALLADGTSEEVVFGDLPFGYHSTNLLLGDFPAMTEAERDATCDAWVQPLRDEGAEVVGVRVDEYVTHLSEPDRSPERVGVLYRCGTAG